MSSDLIETLRAIARVSSRTSTPRKLVEYAQIAKISSTNASFREGTADLGYQDFGRVTTGDLHDVEAIVPQARVGDFAGDVADRLAGRHGGRPLVVQVMLPNGRKLAEAVIPEMPRLLAAHGVG